jgi:hypothetical protein
LLVAVLVVVLMLLLMVVVLLLVMVGVFVFVVAVVMRVVVMVVVVVAFVLILPARSRRVHHVIRQLAAATAAASPAWLPIVAPTHGGRFRHVTVAGAGSSCGVVVHDVDDVNAADGAAVAATVPRMLATATAVLLGIMMMVITLIIVG